MNAGLDRRQAQVRSLLGHIRRNGMSSADPSESFRQAAREQDEATSVAEEPVVAQPHARDNQTQLQESTNAHE